MILKLLAILSGIEKPVVESTTMMDMIEGANDQEDHVVRLGWECIEPI